MECSSNQRKGRSKKDPKNLFNTRLDSKTVRAIDFYEGVSVDEAALKELILDAVRLNTSKKRAKDKLISLGDTKAKTLLFALTN